MRFFVSGWVLFSALVAGACGGEESADLVSQPSVDDEEGAHTCEPGNDVVCTMTEEIPADEVSALGFSANSIMPNLVGRYELPIAWVSPCDGGYGCGSHGGCEAFADQVPASVSGTETVLTVELEATGPPRVNTPGPEQDACGRAMLVPTSLLLRSEDGAVDVERDGLVTYTECGHDLRVGWTATAERFGGKLAVELGAETGASFRFSANDDGRVSMGLSYVRLIEETPRPVTLQAAVLLGNKLCHQTVPRGEVLVAEE